MNATDGVVVRLDGDHAWVRAVGAGSACGACERQGGCQSSGMGSVLDGVLGRGQATQLLRLPNTIHARVGDAVVVCAAEGAVFSAVWQAYGMPLLLALAGAIVGKLLTGSELAAVAGMLAGLCGGYLIMRRRGLGSLDSDRAKPILSINFKRIQGG